MLVMCKIKLIGIEINTRSCQNVSVTKPKIIIFRIDPKGSPVVGLLYTHADISLG